MSRKTLDTLVLAAVLATTLLLFALAGCGPAYGPDGQPAAHWRLDFVNDSVVAQSVTVSVGQYVTSTITNAQGQSVPAGGITAHLHARVDAGTTEPFYFGLPPSFALIDSGLGRTTIDWTGEPPPNYSCPYWAWIFRFPDEAQWGSYPR